MLLEFSAIPEHVILLNCFIFGLSEVELGKTRNWFVMEVLAKLQPCKFLPARIIFSDQSNLFVQVINMLRVYAGTY